MKECTKCKINQSLSEYNKRSGTKDGLQHQCKKCNKANLKKHYNDNKKYYQDKARKYYYKIKNYIDKYKQSRGCKYCNENRYWVLEFHHIGEKETEIAKLLSQCNLKKIKKEIKECEVVCANCHKDIHQNPNNKNKSIHNTYNI